MTNLKEQYKTRKYLLCGVHVQEDGTSSFSPTQEDKAQGCRPLYMQLICQLRKRVLQSYILIQ